MRKLKSPEENEPIRTPVSFTSSTPDSIFSTSSSLSYEETGKEKLHIPSHSKIKLKLLQPVNDSEINHPTKVYENIEQIKLVEPQILYEVEKPREPLTVKLIQHSATTKKRLQYNDIILKKRKIKKNKLLVIDQNLPPPDQSVVENLTLTEPLDQIQIQELTIDEQFDFAGGNGVNETEVSKEEIYKLSIKKI